MGQTAQDVVYDWNNYPRRVTVASFYMDMHEVRNVDYREYLNWLSKVFVTYPQVYVQALPDTLSWRRRLAYNEPYVEYYFRHPAYHNYPVVGVSWLQATDYCAWRTDRVNELMLIDEGILDMNPNLDFIYACSTDTAFGIIDALNERDLNDKIIVNGFTTHMFINAVTKKPTKPPSIYIETLNKFFLN